MTKKVKYSLKCMRQAITIIEELAPKEQKKQSFKRKHQMENAYATLQCHGGRLNLEVPQLGTFYIPEQYLANARMLASQLAGMEEQS